MTHFDMAFEYRDDDENVTMPFALVWAANVTTSVLYCIGKISG